jgi:hypothetical protein
MDNGKLKVTQMDYLDRKAARKRRTAVANEKSSGSAGARE